MGRDERVGSSAPRERCRRTLRGGHSHRLGRCAIPRDPCTDPPTAAEVPKLAEVEFDMAVLAQTPDDRGLTVRARPGAQRKARGVRRDGWRTVSANCVTISVATWTACATVTSWS